MITHFYSSILIFIFVGLSLRTIQLRRSLKVALGHNKNPALIKAIRAHSNFSEYVPLALITLYFVELQSGPRLLVHGIGAALVLGRLLHAYGISQLNENFKFRISGMALTFSSLLTCASYLLFNSLTH